LKHNSYRTEGFLKQWICIEQWSSTWAKSPPGGRFHTLWGRFCDLRDLAGDFSFQEGDFCWLKPIKFWID